MLVKEVNGRHHEIARVQACVSGTEDLLNLEVLGVERE